ncbi:MAG: hypothetical protein HY909_26125 [Deltaproteobacteria bacterium]|nr:hypothetical protein [Deltaproteobacteria bacterium]
MNCERAKPELLGFHFGMAEAEARGALEAHLLGCPACLREYLELKRAVELPEEIEAPSELSRARLRRAVAAELRRGAAPWTWWERPLAVGLAAASVWLAVGTVRFVSTQPGRAPHAMERAP